MNQDARMMVPFSEANIDFSRIMRLADSCGCVVILKNNKSKYLLIDLEREPLIYDLTDEEKLEIASKRILRQYGPPLRNLPNTKTE